MAHAHYTNYIRDGGVLMLQRLATFIGILTFGYFMLTYGSWYVASRFEWQNMENRNGCLRLNFNVPLQSAKTVSPPDNNGKSITTEFVNGFPVFFGINSMEFEIPAFKQKGVSKLALSFSSVTVHLYYDTSDPNYVAGPESSEAIIFERVSTCKRNLES